MSKQDYSVSSHTVVLFTHSSSVTLYFQSFLIFFTFFPFFFSFSLFFQSCRLSFHSSPLISIWLSFFLFCSPWNLAKFFSFSAFSVSPLPVLPHCSEEAEWRNVSIFKKPFKNREELYFLQIYSWRRVSKTVPHGLGARSLTIFDQKSSAMFKQR